MCSYLIIAGALNRADRHTLNIFPMDTAVYFYVFFFKPIGVVMVTGGFYFTNSEMRRAILREGKEWIRDILPNIFPAFPK